MKFARTGATNLAVTASALALATVFASAPVAAQTAQNDDIVVTGIRGAQQKALSLKRDSAQILDSIVAEDIGKLPDVTIADSLQRVTGVQITRSAGEGTTVNVRGLSQVQTTLNGEQFLGANNIVSTQPDFSDVPAALIAGVDVLKSAQASQLEGGISGSLVLKSRRPLDLKKGFTGTASVEGSYGNLSKATNPLGSALIGYHSDDDRFGILISATVSKAKLANFNTRFNNNEYDRVTDADVGFDLTKNGLCASRAACLIANDYVFLPRMFSINTQQAFRDRQALNVSMQYRLTDELTATADFFGTRLQQRNEANDVFLHNNGSLNALQATNLVISPNNVVLNATGNAPRLFGRATGERIKGRADNFNFQLDYNKDDKFTWTARYVHGSNRRIRDVAQADSDYNPLASLVTQPDGTLRLNSPSLNTTTNIGARYNVDVRGDLPVFTFVDGAADPSKTALTSTNAQSNTDRSSLDVFRFDAAYKFDDSFLDNIQFGVRASKRVFSSDAERYLIRYNANSPDSTLTPFADPVNTPREGDFYAKYGPTVFNRLPPDLLTTLTNTGGIGNLPSGGIPAVNPHALALDPFGYLLRLFPLAKSYVIPDQSYGVTERLREIYGQVDLKTELFGVPLSGNVGLRYVQTKLLIHQNLTIGGQTIGSVFLDKGDIDTNRTLHDYLPSVNLRAELQKNLVLRFSYNKAVSRPDLPRLGRGFVQNFTPNQNQYPDLPPLLQITTGGNAGNPNLDPYRTSNFNASLEWYFAPNAALNAAVFQLNVASFPGSRAANEPLADGDGVVRAGGVVTRDFNAGGGTIRGLEIGYQQVLSFLPGALNGFGVQANYTYVESKLKEPQLDFFNKPVPFPDLSKHQANVVLYYQKNGIQARLAGNYRSERFSQLSARNNVGLAASAVPGTTAFNPLAVWINPTFFLDASFSYDVTPNVTVFFQGSNLTGEKQSRYAQFKEQFWDANLFDRRLTAGIRVKM
jgi:TonB-dependent receptor